MNHRWTCGIRLCMDEAWALAGKGIAAPSGQKIRSPVTSHTHRVPWGQKAIKSLPSKDILPLEVPAPHTPSCFYSFDLVGGYHIRLHPGRIQQKSSFPRTLLRSNLHVCLLSSRPILCLRCSLCWTSLGHRSNKMPRLVQRAATYKSSFGLRRMMPGISRGRQDPSPRIVGGARR